MNEVFEQLLAAANEEAAALARTIEERNSAATIASASCLLTTIDRLERAAVLLVITSSSPARQHAVASALDAFHARTQPLLARTPGNRTGLDLRRFVARVPPEPLGQFRSVAGGIIDASGALISGMTLGQADLSLARLADATLRDVDAQGANLDRAIAIEARLRNVRLGGELDPVRELEGLPRRGLRFHARFPPAGAMARRYGTPVLVPGSGPDRPVRR